MEASGKVTVRLFLGFKYFIFFCTIRKNNAGTEKKFSNSKLNSAGAICGKIFVCGYFSISEKEVLERNSRKLNVICEI